MIIKELFYISIGILFTILVSLTVFWLIDFEYHKIAQCYIAHNPDVNKSLTNLLQG